MKGNVRPMRESDLGALAELERQCFSTPWSFEALKDELDVYKRQIYTKAKALYDDVSINIYEEDILI